jgi:hypothetical protein
MVRIREDFDSWQRRRLLSLAAELHLKSTRNLSTEALREKIARKLFWKGKRKPACYGELFNLDYREFPRSRYYPCRVCDANAGCEKKFAQKMERALARRWKGVEGKYYRYRGKRVKRDLTLAKRLKWLYMHRCQICGFYIEDQDGNPVIHVHHIKPLHKVGRMGDVARNMLVLCPNHHLQLDLSQPVRALWSKRTIKCKGKVIKLRTLNRRHWLTRAPSR